MSLFRKILKLPKGGAAKLLDPSANSYFDVIGSVDLREQGGYFDRIAGSVALFVDYPPSQQGGYFNRQ